MQEAPAASVAPQVLLAIVNGAGTVSAPSVAGGLLLALVTTMDGDTACVPIETVPKSCALCDELTTCGTPVPVNVMARGAVAVLSQIHTVVVCAPVPAGWKLNPEIVHEGGAVKFAPITTGLSGETSIEVVKGLKEGQEIVTGPFKALRDIKEGSKVKNQETSKAKGKAKA